MPLGQRKQAEMKPTPRSARMGAIADALMAARDWADKAKVPEDVPLVGGQGLGSLVLGKAPEELTEISYGNMPIRINPLAGRTASYVPEIKPGRKEQVADLAMLAGTPKVGKAGLGLAGGDVGGASERAMAAAIKKAEREQFVSEIEDSIQLTKPTKIKPPTNTVKAYKLFRIDNDGNLYPLFVDAKTPIPVGEWLQAKAGELTREGKVKSSLGPLAYRPGWHAGDLPIATHIGGRYDPKTLQKTKPVKGSKPNVREDNQVWAEVEMPADVDWQTIAESRASIVKSGPNKGQINRSEAHITDQLPLGGHYRYKTNPNMTGNWLIGGEMKVNRVLSDDEVRAINKEAGVSDLPRLSDLAKEYGTQVGFARGGIVKKRIPGFQEGGANIDPVSGNDVPVGSMPEEVRDDIDAKLSPGEFVIPADVVRFIGLERLMKMRDEAKKGLQRMSEIGQMGNADEVGEESNSTYEDEGFESEIDDILEEIEAEENGKDVNEQTEVMMASGGAVGTKTGQTTTAGRPVYKTEEGDNVSELSITVPFKGFWANVPSIHNGVKYDEDQIVEMLNKGKIVPTSVHESIKEAVDAAKARSAGLLDKPEMAEGGFMKSGTDLTKAPKNPVFDVRYYKNAEGSVMYITHINGKPMTPIPEGYKAVTQEEAQKVGQKAEEAAKATQASQQQESSYDATQLDPSVAAFLDEEARQQAEFDRQGRSKEGPREQRMGKVSNVLETVAKWATPYGTAKNVMDFLKGPQRTDEQANKIPTEERTGTSFNEAQSVASTAYSAAINSGLSDVAASRAAAAAVAAYNNNTSDIPDAINTGIVTGQAVQDQIDRAMPGESTAGGDGGSGDNTPGPSPGGTPSNPGSGGIDDNFGMARGGLVNKRQYPAKKKRGKGIAAAKS